MRLGIAAVMMWVSLLAAPAAAQMNMSPTKVVDPVVVTATKLETPAQQLGASVTVIDGDDFQTYHYPAVDEPLRLAPGVEIRRSGSFGKTTSISIRGTNPSQVQVLVDGVRVKSPTLGQAELSDLSPDLIERIEIIRGPQSTLFGADAIGGVVNIITKKGKGPLSATVEQQVGNYDTYVTRANVLGATGPFDYGLGVFRLESNGQFENDDTRQTGVNLRLGMSLPYDSDVAFTLRWNETNTGLPVKFVSAPLPIHPLIDKNNQLMSDSLLTSLQLHTHPVAWWESVLRGGRYINFSNFVDLPDPGYVCAFGVCEFPQRLVTERYEAEWLNHFHVGKWSTSTFGLEYRRETARSEHATIFTAATDTYSGFFQQTFRFLDRLFMSAGVRVEENSVYGRSTTERGSLSYAIKDWGTRIRGGAGSGFRAPTFNDLFFPGFSDVTLKPETSFSYDFGVDQELWNKRVRLGLTYFQNDVRNLITFVPINTPPFVKGANVGHARSAGIEVTADTDLTDTLTLSVNYTYTDTENLAIDRPLAREPRHRWNGTITWQALPRLTLFTQVHAVTSQFEPTGGSNGVYNSGHTRVDVGGTYRILNRYAFLKALDLTGRVQNLLDEGYAEVRGFPSLGIQGFLGLRASF
jgi:vitamin B12 transporter